MRNTTSILTGGSVLGLLGVTGILLTTTDQTQARPSSTPDTISLTGKIRDFPPHDLHADFQVNPSATPGARSACNIAGYLDSENKPQYVGPGKRVNQEWTDSAGRKVAWCQVQYDSMDGDDTGSWTNGQNGIDSGGIKNADSFAQWYRDVPGVNMSRLWTINLTKDGDGNYVYDTANFNPIDHQLFGNGFSEQNFYFTYEIVATFTAAAGQFIEFKGSDDCWIFIQGPGYETGKLLIDHGGIAANREQYVSLDRYMPAEGGNMVAGAEYKFYLFHAERSQPQSQFALKTNIFMTSAVDNSIFAAFD